MKNKLICIIVTAALLVCTLSCVFPVSAADSVTIKNVDTVMIYNPLMYYAANSYKNGVQQSSATVNALSTGDMSTQINRTRTRVWALMSGGNDSGIISLSQNELDHLVLPNSKAAAEEPVMLPFNASYVSYTVGNTHQFYVQDDMAVASSRGKRTFTCRAVGTHCLVWTYNTTAVTTAMADAMVTEFDDLIYPNHTDEFGSAKLLENGDKLNILIYPISYTGASGTLSGYFQGAELLSAAELGIYANSYNSSSAIIHINSGICSATSNEEVNITIAHEFQHLICYTSMLKGAGKYYGITVNDWLNECMSMWTGKKLYPDTSSILNYVSYTYNYSSSIAGGQSLYNFSTASDIGVYGQVLLFAEYLDTQQPDDTAFANVHNYWRTATSTSLLSESRALYNSVPQATRDEILASVDYSGAITTRTSSTYDEYLSKLNLSFQISTATDDESGIYASGELSYFANPYTSIASNVSIEGGGRIFVKTADSSTYTVPTGADEKLIYVGFKDGVMTVPPTTAANYTEPVIHGDVTGDGKINALDLLRIKLYLNGKVTLDVTAIGAADVTGDGNVNALDLLRIKLYLNGKIVL